MKPTFRARALLLAAGLLAALLVGEIAVRLAIRWTGRNPVIVSDARLGWTLIPGMRGRLKVENLGRYRISTDAEGHRLTSASERTLPPSAPAVILLGDSFVQGQGVADDETFAWRLAAGTGRSVVNLGVLGYGTDQELLAIEGFLARHPSMPVSDVVALLFENDPLDVGRDFRSAMGMSKPRFVLSEMRLQRLPYRQTLAEKTMGSSMLFWLLRTKYYRLARKEESRLGDGIEVVAGCLAEIRRIAAGRGARFQVLAYHQPLMTRLRPNDWRRLLELSGAEDISELISSPKLPSPIGYDGLHWNAEGHRRMAAILDERLRRH